MTKQDALSYKRNASGNIYISLVICYIVNTRALRMRMPGVFKFVKVMEEVEHPENQSYKSSMWIVTRWLMVALAITLIIIFFKPVNIWLNRGETHARVVSIYEIYSKDYDPDTRFNFGKKYNVQYEFMIDGKTYTGKSEMKFSFSLNPNSVANSSREVSPADVADIEIVYCRHWPGWFYVKNSRVEYSYGK